MGAYNHCCMNFTDHSHRVQFESFDILQDEEVSLSPLLFYSSVMALLQLHVTTCVQLCVTACVLRVLSAGPTRVKDILQLANISTGLLQWRAHWWIGHLEGMRAMWCASCAHVCGMCHYRSDHGIYSGMHLSVLHTHCHIICSKHVHTFLHHCTVLVFSLHRS